MYCVHVQTKIKQEMSETILNLYFFSQPAFTRHLLWESTFSKIHGQIEKKKLQYMALKKLSSMVV